MLASMWMMHDALDGLIADEHLDELSKIRCLRGVLPYTGDCAFQREHLYVVDTSMTPAPPRQVSMEAALSADKGARFIVPDEPSYLLLVGTDFDAAEDVRCQYVVMNPTVTFVQALDAASRAFVRYEGWNDRLHDELMGRHDLNRLCKIGTELLENPIMIYDRDYTIIGNDMFPDYAEYFRHLEKTSSYYRAKPGFLNRLKSLPSFQATFETHGAALFAPDAREYSDEGRTQVSDIYVNFGLGGIYEGRAVIPDMARPFKPGDFQLAEIFTDVVRVALKQPSTQHDDLDQVFRTYLVGMLEGRAVDDRQLQDSLRLWNWPRRGRFVCVSMRLSPSDIETSVDVFVCTKIELELPGSCAIGYHDTVACVANLEEGRTVEDVAALFEHLFGDFALCIGISEVYADVLETDAYHREAQIAVEMGARIDAGAWCHRFRDFAMRHYYEHGTSELSAIHFCDGDVKRLMVYRGQRKDYYEVLETYLRNNMNLLRTSEALFIHRTTLFNYLKDIRGIIDADLDDVDQRLRMLFSFEVMRMAGEE